MDPPASAAHVAKLEAELAYLRARVAELERECSSEPDAVVRALRESERLLLAVIDNTPSTITVKDVEGRYLLVNRSLEELVGKPRAELLGRTDVEAFGAQVASAFRAEDEEVMRSGQLKVTEKVWPMAEGDMIYLMLKFPLHDLQGRVSGVCVISTDITQTRRAEAERAALQEQVITAQKAAMRELSTPLVPIAAGVIAMPLVGAIDAARADQIMSTLLEGIGQHGAHTAIMDITGVRTVDTYVAGALLSAAQAARLLGARVVLTGIRGDVALALANLGVKLGEIVTRGTLEAGIAYALSERAGARHGSWP